MGGGKAGGGEHGSAESERESEDGMLPLDHFEGDAEVVEDGHGKIVEQAAVLSSPRDKTLQRVVVNIREIACS